MNFSRKIAHNSIALFGSVTNGRENTTNRPPVVLVALSYITIINYTPESDNTFDTLLNITRSI